MCNRTSLLQKLVLCPIEECAKIHIYNQIRIPINIQKTNQEIFLFQGYVKNGNRRIEPTQN